MRFPLMRPVKGFTVCAQKRFERFRPRELGHRRGYLYRRKDRDAVVGTYIRIHADSGIVTYPRSSAPDV